MIRRNIEDAIRQALADTPVVLLNGARQTGKTTLAQALAENTGAEYFTLDDAATLALRALVCRGGPLAAARLAHQRDERVQPASERCLTGRGSQHHAGTRAGSSRAGTAAGAPPTRAARHHGQPNGWAWRNRPRGVRSDQRHLAEQASRCERPTVSPGPNGQCLSALGLAVVSVRPLVWGRGAAGYARHRDFETPRAAFCPSPFVGGSRRLGCARGLPPASWGCGDACLWLSAQA